MTSSTSAFTPHFVVKCMQFYSPLLFILLTEVYRTYSASINITKNSMCDLLPKNRTHVLILVTWVKPVFSTWCKTKNKNKTNHLSVFIFFKVKTYQD